MSRLKPAASKITGIAIAISALATTAGALAATLPGRYEDPFHAKVDAAGYVQKTAKVNDITLSYVEGPDNGPPLVLLHAQLLDWFAYSRVLPELARSFHVFDIDYPGHGATKTPADYPMTANQIGTDLASFIDTHIGGQVFASGNSSGGLLAIWLASHRPDLVKAVALEDPPLFSSEYPRIKTTIANKAFYTSYTAATKDHPSDFLLYWVAQNKQFFIKNIGKGSPFILTEAIKIRRRVRPGQPVELGIVKNDTYRMLIRGLADYDPRFGAAFYDGTWNAGFDHADALRHIQCPTLLMQANWTFMDDGTLDGAMTQGDADRAMALLRKGSYERVDASHVVNLDKPDAYIAILKNFFLGPTTTYP